MADDAPFYVGYLPLDRGAGLATGVRAGAFAGVMLLIALSASWAQRRPGDGEWRDGEIVTESGVFLALPAPMIVDQNGRVTLLVDPGKHGAVPPAGLREGGAVRATGTLLTRANVRLLELAQRAGIESAGEWRGVAPALIPLGDAVLVGEIVDPKCYAGAMKPGDGVAHKACATLCIEGGIPPMLALEGSGRLVLLGSPGAGPVGDWILPFVAERVCVRGRAARIADLDVLCVAPGAVTRAVSAD